MVIAKDGLSLTEAEVKQSLVDAGIEPFKYIRDWHKNIFCCS